MIRGKKSKEEWEKQTRGYRMTSVIALGLIAVFVTYILIAFVALRVLDGFGYDISKLQDPRIALLNIFFVSMVYAVLATYIIMRKIFKPIEELSNASQQVAKGDYDVQLQYDGKVEELSKAINNFNKMVKELNSVEIMSNDFIADVSHEFKTPLSAISGYATFLQDPELSDAEKADYIKKIFFNIDKLNDLTENILRLSKLEHQQYDNEPVTYRLDEQIREAVVLLEPKWNKKAIEFDINMPEVLFRGQRSLLFQVWTNIIGNAIKYTDNKGKITIQIKEKNDNVKVMVSDTGIGMSEETQKHIFDKFYQGDTSRKSQGNGLGLSLCKEIVKRCGGDIYVESTVGVGTVFIVKLPIEKNM
ncbi:MAG: HAMP domain-containing histidine kinase [Lachnospiraceae bacterium]|nr:HAMP domain-containing histidine kinase [Lachnospiraceae bacterium]